MKRPATRIAMLAISFFTAIALLACDDKSTYTEFKIANETVYFPSNYKFVKYIPQDQVAEFTIDVETFQPIENAEGLKKGTVLAVEIRPLGSEFGEKYYWTKDDPALKAKPISCQNTDYQNKTYLLCSYDKKAKIVNAMDELFTVQIANSKDFTSILGCMRQNNAGAVCMGRSRITKDIQIEYVFYKKHFSRVVEITQELENVSLKLLQAPGESNGLPTKSKSN